MVICSWGSEAVVICSGGSEAVVLYSWEDSLYHKKGRSEVEAMCILEGDSVCPELSEAVVQ